MNRIPTIMITAADVSGDVHAAALIKALRRRLGDVRFVGLGGERMAAAGCELLAEPVSRSVMLTGPAGQLSYYWRLIRLTARAMDEYSPAAHVPVDSPALNWHLAKAARRRRIPVIYYVAPQTWAWAPWRVRKLRRLTDVVACILPFEQEYFRSRGVNAHYVGHPLFDGLPDSRPPDLESAAAQGCWRIALVPGSRSAEIRAHAPALAAVMDALSRKYPDASFVFTAIDEKAADLIRRSARRSDLPIEVANTADVLSRTHLAVAASGTVTLEIAHFGAPMIVFYSTGWLAGRLLRPLLIRTRHLSLVNILAGKRLVPELIPWFGDASELVGSAEAMLRDVSELRRVRRELLELVKPLRVQPPGSAADNTAELIVDAMA